MAVSKTPLTLSGNTANHNGGAGYLVNSDNNTLSGNTANHNVGDGFRLEYGSTGNTLSGNRAERNGGYGFFVDPDIGALDNFFEDNECFMNALGGDNRDDIDIW